MISFTFAVALGVRVIGAFFTSVAGVPVVGVVVVAIPLSLGRFPPIIPSINGKTARFLIRDVPALAIPSIT